jgi:hypothetical protein
MDEERVSVTVGGGLSVYGTMEAVNRVQDYILLDSSHPVEKEDVRRSLMRQLVESESKCDALREESATFRRLLESKQEELARVQRALDIERIQWRESLREKDEETQRWRRKYEAKEWR